MPQPLRTHEARTREFRNLAENVAAHVPGWRYVLDEDPGRFIRALFYSASVGYVFEVALSDTWWSSSPDATVAAARTLVARLGGAADALVYLHGRVQTRRVAPSVALAHIGEFPAWHTAGRWILKAHAKAK